MTDVVWAWLLPAAADCAGMFCYGQVCSDIHVCGDGVVKRFPGSFEEYKKHTLSKQKKPNT
jgi:hypothetical protein